MIKKTIYVNGCSWTDGDVLDYTNLIKKLQLNGVGRDYSYPTLVANYFNFNLIDESRYGGSTNRLIRLTWKFIMSQKNISDTIFLLEIPHGFRDEKYSSKYKRYFNITSGNLTNPEDMTEHNKEWKDIEKDIIYYYENFWDYEEFTQKEYIDFMCLIDYIKSFTDEIYIIHFQDLFYRIQHAFNKNIIDDKNKIILTHSSFKKNTPYETIYEMCVAEHLSIGDNLENNDSHPNIDGHKIIADIIIKHFEKKGKIIKHFEKEGKIIKQTKRLI